VNDSRKPKDIKRNVTSLVVDSRVLAGAAIFMAAGTAMYDACRKYSKMKRFPTSSVRSDLE
jgi:hypothetical protein